MTTKRWTGWLVVSGFIAALGSGCGEDEAICHGPDGTLEAGATYRDGCNDCLCNDDGSITCELDAGCKPCEYEGERYAIGASWGAGDGCNLCQCQDPGEVTCTATACSD